MSGAYCVRWGWYGRDIGSLKNTRDGVRKSLVLNPGPSVRTPSTNHTDKAKLTICALLTEIIPMVNAETIISRTVCTNVGYFMSVYKKK